MLARELLRDRPEEVRDRLATRGVEAELFNTWEELDHGRREALVEMEELKRQRNEASKAIGKIKGEGGDATERIEEVGRLKSRIGELEEKVNETSADLSALEMAIPNLPDASVPVGKDEEANRVERVVGEEKFEHRAATVLSLVALGVDDHPLVVDQVGCVREQPPVEEVAWRGAVCVANGAASFIDDRVRESFHGGFD